MRIKTKALLSSAIAVIISAIAALIVYSVFSVGFNRRERKVTYDILISDTYIVANGDNFRLLPVLIDDNGDTADGQFIYTVEGDGVRISPTGEVSVVSGELARVLIIETKTGTEKIITFVPEN